MAVTGTILDRSYVTGFIRTLRASAAGSREERVVAGEPRPLWPFLVRAVRVKQRSEIASIPAGSYYLIANDYDQYLDDPWFYEEGGSAGCIARKADPPGTVATYRTPSPKEVVGHTDGAGLLQPFRFDAGWMEYEGPIERAMRYMHSFQVLDPERIWRYVGRLLDLIGAQLAYDTELIRRMLVPEVCPASLLHTLAFQYGLRTYDGETEEQLRSLIATAVPTFKLRGLEAAVIQRVQSLGYRAAVLDVWVYIKESLANTPEGWLDQPNQSRAAFPWFATEGLTAANLLSSTGTILRVAGNVTVTWAGVRWIQVRDAAGSPREGDVYFVHSMALVGGNTNINVGAPVAYTAPRKVTPVTRSWLAVRHGFYPYLLQDRWPTSRILLSLSQRDGTPIDAAPSGYATLDAFYRFILDNLHADVLPAFVDVKDVGPLAGDVVAGGPDGLTISETLTLANIP